ncbi:MAG: GAF domain-containing protein [Gammaproteobacteria bacterium]|nr:GAF domain-containing protein [Gammaproteobacteria bacterium]
MSETDYILLNKQLDSLLSEQPIWYTNLSQFSALIMASLENINWAGFYLLVDPENLKLGPFQGLVACMDIRVGEGVCGTAAKSRRTQRIADVHQFEGHIACDARSQSEIVIPMLVGDRLLGVMDIDSPNLERFSHADEIGLTNMVQTLLTKTQWPEQF